MSGNFLVGDKVELLRYDAGIRPGTTGEVGSVNDVRIEVLWYEKGGGFVAPYRYYFGRDSIFAVEKFIEKIEEPEPTELWPDLELI